eukprot:TRINITY_DN13031_c0_g1_i1.p1 TRINITY_DN13031_c0_g1~~TRINITY_DN13031_c0_g1_i1.p1  ORF type:complete len:268 (-),score=37.99 TRINITY_DN13031_c0_g1_i1:22-825(-)
MSSPSVVPPTSSFSQHALLLDVEIRNYVLLPILLLMILVTILRNDLSVLFNWSSSTNELKKIRENHLLLRTRRLRASTSKIPLESFERRKAFFVHPEQGLLTKKSKPPKNQEALPGMANNPMMDPSNMGNMAKGQATMIFSQIYMLLLYSIIDYFFPGFVAAKLPFALTRGFKGMFQDRIDLPTLEVSYVSSSSWFFLIFSGLRELSVVLLGAGANIPIAPEMNQQQMMFDPTKAFATEAENLNLTQHVWACEDSLQRLVSKKHKNK